MKNRDWSFRSIIVTALVTFTVSGVGGILLTRHLARARPELTVTHVQLKIPADPTSSIMLSAELAEALKPVGYPELSEETTPAQLAHAELIIRQRIQGLSSLLQRLSKVKPRLDEDELFATYWALFGEDPYVADRLFMRLGRLASEGKFPNPPVGLNELSKYVVQYPLEVEHKSAGITFSEIGIYSKFDYNEDDDTKLLAESVSRAVMPNIRYMLGAAEASTADDPLGGHLRGGALYRIYCPLGSVRPW